MSINLADLDRRHVWHPHTRFSTIAAGPLPSIVRGEGLYLFDADGNRYADAIASWWCCCLGHGHPRIVEAIRRQAGQLQHSILAGLSHPRVAELAARLANVMPSPDRHVLFASDGASAVEAALKIALQYWDNHGVTKRHQFAYLDNAYHGDTFGAMSVGFLEHFHRPFEPVLMTGHGITVPYSGADMEAATNDLRDLLVEHASELAGVIVEPLCQCAAGMKTYPAEFLRLIGVLCRELRIPLIVDEIATGMGRAGTMFAFQQAGIDPDIVCLGKALAAGYVPISATIVKDRIHATFGDSPDDHTLYHGHTFGGNPVAAAAAIETLGVFEDERILDQARETGRRISAALAPLAGWPGVREVRCLGAMGAVEFDDATRAAKAGNRLRAQRILVRPLGGVIYLMPPLNTPSADLDALLGAFCEAVGSAG